MPRRRIEPEAAPPAMTWEEEIIRRLRAGTLVPIVGRRLGDELAFGGHEAVLTCYGGSADWAKTRGLVEMLQYRSVADTSMVDEVAFRNNYVDFVKNLLFDMAEKAGAQPSARKEVEDRFDELSFSQFCDKFAYPAFDDPDDPFLLLASFDLPLYITTDLHDFLEMALRKAGKRPRSDFCRWRPELKGLPSAFDAPFQDGRPYVPVPEEPLVYHLFGRDEDPSSLVLTEDDHLQFLAAVYQNLGRQGTEAIDSRVSGPMSLSSLMLLGYRLEQWDLRALFWSLIVPRSTPVQGVAIQLEPSETERSYLQRYLKEYKFEVMWDTAQGYLLKLYHALNS